MKAEIDSKLLADPVFQRVLKDALAIQDRFAAEPVYAKTGTGVLKSSGVTELQTIKTGGSESHLHIEKLSETPAPSLAGAVFLGICDRTKCASLPSSDSLD